MKVLHVAHNFPPEFHGGIERVVESLALAQGDLGHDVAVLCGSERVGERPCAIRETRDGMAVTRLVRGPGIHDGVDPFDAGLAPLLEDALESARPDVVHVHHWFHVGADVVRRASRRGIPAVVTLHDFYSTCGSFFRLPNGRDACDLEQSEGNCGPCLGGRAAFDAEELRFAIAERRLAFHAELRAAAFVTAPSVAHRAALLAHVPGGLDVDVVPPGSAPRVAPPRRARAGALRVLHFGNLCRLKGVDFLVRAVRAADPGGARITLSLAGQAVEPDLDLAGARLLGPYDSAALRDLAADADVAAFPSFARESYGIVVDEALRLGLPVLVSDRGALAERVGARGLVLPAGDLGVWADNLRRLAADPAALDALDRGAHGALATSADSAVAMLSLYARARPRPVSTSDVEAPLLRRLRHVQERMAELARVLGSHRAV